MPSGRATWLSAKRTRAGRDPRLHETGGAVNGDRMLLSSAVTAMKRVEMENWLKKGPSAVAEVLSSIRATGLEPQSGLADEVCILLAQVWFMVSVTAWTSPISRRRSFWLGGPCKCIGRCTGKCRSPDISGLESFT